MFHRIRNLALAWVILKRTELHSNFYDVPSVADPGLVPAAHGTEACSPSATNLSPHSGGDSDKHTTKKWWVDFTPRRAPLHILLLTKKKKKKKTRWGEKEKLGLL